MSTEKVIKMPTILAEGPGRKSRARFVVAFLVAIFTLAVAAIGVRWLGYRSEHVVVDDAAVKGTITRLGARIDGQIKGILVQPGQHVSKGELLVQLEDQHLKAALMQAHAQLESATNELRSETISIEEDRHRLTLEEERAESLVKAAAATLEGAQSTADRLKSEYPRVAELAKQGYTSQSELDLITGQRGAALAAVKTDTEMRDAAQSARQTAKAQLEALRVREAHLGVLRAAVSLAQAKIVLAQADVEAATLCAPEDGWVIERLVELGGSAKVGEPILSLWIGSPWVEAWANEKDLRRIDIGNRVQLSFDAFPSQLVSGRVEALGVVTDRELTNHVVPSTLDALMRKNAKIPVRIALDQGNLRLQPGLSVVAGIAKQSPHALAEAEAPTGRFRALASHFASSGMIARGESKTTVNSQP